MYDGDCYWRYLKRLADEGDMGALALLGCVFKRAAISHESAAKLKLIPQIIELLVNKAHRKLLVFFERIWTSEVGQDDLLLKNVNRIRDAVGSRAEDDDSIWCMVYHSGQKDRERNAVLEEFRSIGPSALLACRSLDEGLDVPTVDVGILVASTQSERQRLQRIGRTLRRASRLEVDRDPLDRPGEPERR